jgi:hypothetical protein
MMKNGRDGRKLIEKETTEKMKTEETIRVLIYL